MAGSKPAASLEDSGHPAQPSPEQILERFRPWSEFSRPHFSFAPNACAGFSRFTVELTLSGETDRIKEYTLGRDVFDRDKNYDPRADSIVRVEARRLRKKLGEYYQEFGSTDPVSIEFPAGQLCSGLPAEATRCPPPDQLRPLLPEPRPLNPRTVAVLPFRNLSSDPDQDFFCEGIAEEILNTLTTVPQLNVVARTSVFRFKGSHDVREIGRQLHAGTVIEGSVRKAGNRLRISAQAIDAIRESCYGPALSTAISPMCSRCRMRSRWPSRIRCMSPWGSHARLLPSGKRKPALEAYTLLLKGRHFWNQVSQTGMQAALAEFTRAISLYPDYAPPYAALAEAYLKLTFWGVVPPREGISRARQAALEAIRLDPKLADAYAFLGAIASAVTTGSGRKDPGCCAQPWSCSPATCTP